MTDRTFTRAARTVNVDGSGHVVLLLAVLVADLTLPARQSLNGAQLTGGTLGDLLLFGMLTGVASMAIIETVKRLTTVRGRFQIIQIARWLDARSPAEPDPPLEVLSKRDRYQAFGDLAGVLGLHKVRDSPRLFLSTTSDERSMARLFNLPIEQVSAQIAAAADLAMAFPEANSRLLATLAGTPTWSPPDHHSVSAGPDEDTRLLLSHQVRTGLNLLQITVGQRWTWQLRMAGCWLSGVIGLLVVTVGYVPPSLTREYALAALVTGGFFAWLARDLSALVERLRR